MITLLKAPHVRRATARYIFRAKRLLIKKSSNATNEIPAPTSQQLRFYFLTTAIPMVGFGFMDQTVMIQAGNAIDCSLGVAFGLSTLAAAALGQVVSGAAAALFGGTLDNLFRKMGLPRSGLTSAQRSLTQVKRVHVYGNLFGVVTGCLLGLVNFLFIDTDQSSKLKLQAMNNVTEFAYEIEASNQIRKDATIFEIRGPDIDGLLASITTALTTQGCSLVEVHAQKLNDDVKDFLVVRRGGQQIPSEELREVARILVEATSAPLNVQMVRAQNKELQEINSELNERVEKLQDIIKEKQIRIEP